MRPIYGTFLLGAVAACALPPPNAQDIEQTEQGLAEALTSADTTLLDAPANTWQYVEFDGTQCRDGSKAGLHVRRSPGSSKLLIFMEGGGVCFDADTCAGNDANVQQQLADFPSLDGLLNTSNVQNPVRDWNMVYVPYCTGDLHGGTRSNVTIEGVAGPQQFVGRLNLQRFLRPLTKLSKAPSDVMLVGVSAGGLGAAMSLPTVQNAFDKAFRRRAPKVRLVNDSGPFLDTNSLPLCLQQTLRTTFGYDASFLADWPEGKKHLQGEFMTQYATWLARSYSDRNNGFIESTADYLISAFYGIGYDEGRYDCAGNFGTAVPHDVLQASLLAFRDAIKRTSTGTFYPVESTHTYLETSNFYTVSAGGKSLRDWFTRVVNDKNAGNFGP